MPVASEMELNYDADHTILAHVPIEGTSGPENWYCQCSAVDGL